MKVIKKIVAEIEPLGEGQITVNVFERVNVENYEVDILVDALINTSLLEGEQMATIEITLEPVEYDDEE